MMKHSLVFRKYTIAARIGLVVGLILFAMLFLVYIEIRGLNTIKENLAEITGRYSDRLQLVHDIRYQARHNAVLVRNILLAQESHDRETALARFRDAEQEYGRLYQRLQAFEHSGPEKDLVSQVGTSGQEIFGLWKMVLETEQKGDKIAAVNMLMDMVRTQQAGWLTYLGKLVELEEAEARLANDRAMQEYIHTKTIMAAINLLAITAGVYFMVTITASIVLPLHEMARQVDSLALGDFSVRVEAQQRDELGMLGTRINNMAEKLQENEKKLKEYQQHMEELVALRTEEIEGQRERFISVLIHDLKAPLVPILGFARLLANKKDLDREKISEYAMAITTASGKLSANIEQTSQELRDRRLAHHFEEEPVDLQDLLDQVVRDTLPQAKRNNLQITILDPSPSMEQEPLLIMQADGRRIRSVIENILNNAVKYARSEIQVSLVRCQDQAHLTVDDDGPGIADLYKEKVFEEYFQVPGCKPGTGIGLFSVKQTMEHYRGTVDVLDAPAGGARFAVCFPLHSFCYLQPERTASENDLPDSSG